MKNFSILLLSTILLTGCASLEPYVQEFNIISIPEEKQIGEKIAVEISKQMEIVKDPAPVGRVNAIGRQLVTALPQQDFQYEFYVVRDETPNAFTIPGGKIYVHTGLLDFVGDDSELAGVLGHELGHAYARHPAKGLSRQLGVEYLSGLLFKDPQGKFRTLALQLATQGALTRYSREDERQADELGYTFLRRAGFRTDGLLRFLRRLLSIQGRGTPLPFLSTHPPTPERIARLEQLESGRVQVAPRPAY